MKSRFLIYAAVSLIAALYVYDRNNKDEVLVAATVVEVTSQVAEKGSDTWHIRAAIDTGEVILEPRLSRPDVAVDDRICVTEVVRQGQPSEYLFAPNATC